MCIRDRITSRAWWLFEKYHAPRRRFVGTLDPNGCFPFEFSTLSENKHPKCRIYRVLPRLCGPSRTPPENGNTIEDSHLEGAGARNLNDSAPGRSVKYGTFGTTFAPFPGESRGPFPKSATLSMNRRYGSLPGRRFTVYSEMPL